MTDFKNQKFSDGIIELITYPGPVALAMEKTFPGQGSRIAQLNGSIIIDFNEKDYNGNKIVTYAQIDGEYYKIISPKSFKVEKSSAIPNSRIKILIANTGKWNLFFGQNLIYL